MIRSETDSNFLGWLGDRWNVFAVRMRVSCRRWAVNLTPSSHYNRQISLPPGDESRGGTADGQAKVKSEHHPNHARGKKDETELGFHGSHPAVLASDPKSLALSSLIGHVCGFT
ncbi:MAG: hypothetical protein ACLQNE_33335 [Thermoguttaceae bacterium]